MCESMKPEESAVTATPSNRSDTLAAWCSLLIGYLFCCVFPVVTHPLGGALFVVSLFTAAIVFFAVNRFSLSAEAIAVSVSAVVIGVSLFLNGNVALHFFGYAYAMVAFLYLVYSATDSKLEQGLSSFLFADLIRAAIVMPFASFGKLFPTIAGRSKKGNRAVLKILLGIVLAIVPTVAVLLLLSYDSDFVKLLKAIVILDAGDVLLFFLRIGFGVPVGMYIYGLLFSGRNKRARAVLSVGTCRMMAERSHRLPSLTLVAACVPMLLIYAVFFFSQWQHYVSAFTGVLPSNTLYAQYAREGFFELCAVAAINLAMTVAIALFAQRHDGKTTVLTRVLILLYAAATLVLLSTAVSKMVLYIQRFGLTPMRVYASWFLLVLAVVFTMIAVRIFVAKFRIVPIATATVVVLFAILSLVGIDTRIAEYNVGRYLNGSLSTVDVDAMYELGDDDAVPVMCKLAEYLDEKYGEGSCALAAQSEEPVAMPDLVYDVGTYLSLRANDTQWDEEASPFSLTLPQWKAKRALIQYGWLKNK